jgi:hypothetical protein
METEQYIIVGHWKNKGRIKKFLESNKNENKTYQVICKGCGKEESL